LTNSGEIPSGSICVLDTNVLRHAHKTPRARRLASLTAVRIAFLDDVNASA
jgi:hypothetical protein